MDQLRVDLISTVFPEILINNINKSMKYFLTSCSVEIITML